MYIVVGQMREQSDMWETVTHTDSGHGARRRASSAHLPQLIRDVEQRAQTPVRWVFSDTRTVLPLLLDAGITVSRCHDLRLVQRILVTAASRPQNKISYEPVVLLLEDERAPAPGMLPPARVPQEQGALFETDLFEAAPPEDDSQPTVELLERELATQLASIESSPHPARLALLAAAESQGGIIAAEMKHYGMPWNREIHEGLLRFKLGERPAPGQRPYKLEVLAATVRERLGAPQLNPDSPQELLKALNMAGVNVSSTNKWGLRAWAQESALYQQEREKLIEPLLEYKKLSRLLTANGWNWLDEWVHNNRFYPAYEVGGVVTGRWGARGGGAMQIPKEVRSAVHAEAGMILTVADASQVEPRILAALSGDQKLAIAGADRDLYLGIAALGERTGSALTERNHAKIALLGAMYGATTGESGRLMPHLKKLFPQAIEFTEQAARIGERGGQVTTFLGRTSPAPGDEWFRRQRYQQSAADERAAQAASRSWGRFTRNFVVQGTAAEWAVCWMGQIRARLRQERLFGKPLQSRLVYFLHDEIMIYGPEREGSLCQKIVRESAQSAAELIFGQIPVQFPVTGISTHDYSQAK